MKISRIIFNGNKMKLFTLWFGLLFGLSLQTSVLAEQRLALVIGNQNYQRDPLDNPVNDAQDMTKVLRQVGFQVEVLYNLSLEPMETAIRNFGNRLKSGGVGLFYFSGHGVQYQGQNYLFPIGSMPKITAPGHLKHKTVNVDYVLAALEGANNGLNIIILDACRHNPFKGLFRSGLGNDGLALLQAPSGSLIAYATGPNTRALDGEGHNSPYVKYLQREILTPGISIEEMFRRVRVAVMKETNQQQEPGYYSELNRPFCFVEPCGTTQLPVAQPPSLPVADDVVWLTDKVFRDRLKNGSLGPEMVVIPAGRFRMGNIQGGGKKDEQPVHEVSIESFAMGRYEVTFAEYDQFAQATGTELPNDWDWGRGKRPVINVSWRDAVAYAQWLSQQTGKRYRLPTEAEWEYAARAGTETNYWWGNEVGHNRANCDGCGSQWDNKMTAPVGSFTSNPFGLYDTAGNVWEWTCSKYFTLYNGQEQSCANINDGSFWEVVIRGGCWGFNPGSIDATNRYSDEVPFRGNALGFRLVRR